jgi:hypothetical protein|tara:strand:+ start:232 stop:474 length:243 start_codon:yes stop_codon:yes gene_type:complete
MQLQGINGLTKDELKQLLDFSNDETNITERYVVACQIISNLLEEDIKQELENFDDSVDLTICKMLLDGDVVVEPEDRKLH